MSNIKYLWTPPPVASLPIRGKEERLPVNRMFLVGRNYHAHAAEMGKSVDKSVEKPFYFTKSLHTLVQSGQTIHYPPKTTNFHFEMELVVVIGHHGFQVAPEKAHSLIYGYACGLDMTRRDLQLSAREQSRPWDLGKDVEETSICSEVVPMPEKVIEDASISLTVNGQTKQNSNVSKLIWNIREIIADLSLHYHLEPGDLIYTGTPEGVGPVVPGDKLHGEVGGVGSISLTIGEPKKA